MEFQAWGRYAQADGGDVIQIPVALHLVRDRFGVFDLDDEQVENVLGWWPETLREVNEYYRSISAGLQLVWVPPVEGLFGTRLLTLDGPEFNREMAFVNVDDECRGRVETFCGGGCTHKLSAFTSACGAVYDDDGNRGYQNRGILDVYLFRWPPGYPGVGAAEWARCRLAGRAWVTRVPPRVIVYPYPFYEHDVAWGWAGYTLAHEAGHAIGNLRHTPLAAAYRAEQGWDAAGRSHRDPRNLMQKSCRSRPLDPEDVILLTGQIYAMRANALAVVGESCSSALEADVLSAF